MNIFCVILNKSGDEIEKVVCLFITCFLLMGCQTVKTEKISVEGIQTIPYEELNELLNDDVTFFVIYW